MSSATSVTISLALMLLFGFLLSRLLRLLRLPNVTAYILAGILLGPFGLGLIPQTVIAGMDFLPDLALCFIAFSVGEFFEFDTLKKNGMKVVVITLFESLAASAVIFIVTYFIMKLGMAFSVMLSALAAATAPASTIMTIRQTRAKGDLVNTLLQVVALDDVGGLVAYSIAISVALSSLHGAGADRFAVVVLPIIKNLCALAIGALAGVVLRLTAGSRQSTDNRLIIAISVLVVFCGLCSYFDTSPLLGCMAIGTVYINLTKDNGLFKQLNYFSPPILLLFFVRSGMNFQLGDLFSQHNAVHGIPLITISLVYFLLRIAGKYAGAWLGCFVTKKDARVRRYLGLGLVPQAGVAIGLAAMCARILGPGIGTDMQTIIMFSSVLYELIGPACGKLCLYLSGSYSTHLEDLTEVAPVDEEGKPRPQIEILIERIRQIQEELPVHPEPHPSPEEAAFQQAAEEHEAYEYLDAGYRTHPGQLMGRRYN